MDVRKKGKFNDQTLYGINNNNNNNNNNNREKEEETNYLYIL